MKTIYKKAIATFLPIACLSLNLFAQTTYTIGTGAGSNASSSYPAPYGTYTGPARQQFLILKAELTAAGASAGKIVSIAFNPTNLNACGAQQNYTISLKNTATASLTGSFEAGTTLVYGPTTFTPPGTGYANNKFTLTTPFCWDGTSNILVDICQSNTTWTNNASFQWTTGMAFNSSSYDYNDPNACTSTATPLSTSTSRPNMQFAINPPTPDLAAQSIVSPGGSATLGSFPIVMSFLNNSCAGTITTATLGYNWNNDGNVTESWGGSLTAGTSTTHTFATNANATISGPNSLKVWATYPNGIYPDGLSSNDTLSTFVYVGSGVDTSGYNGKNFWVAFMQNDDNGAGGEANWALLLTIASINTAHVTITAPNISATPLATLTLTPNSAQTVNLTNPWNGTQLATTTDEAISNTGINIVSDSPVTVYGISLLTATTDGFLAIPNNNLGTQYLAFAPTGFYSLTATAPSEFIVVATQNNTTLSITPKTATRTKAAGTPINVTIPKAGQTYMLFGKVSSSSSNDLTGSLITSNKPVAVLGGSQCSDVPWLGATGNCAACNHLIEELTPTTSWGKHFLLGHFSTRSAPDFIRIISSFAGTTNITLNGTPYTLAGQGSYKDLTSSSFVGAEIIADQPIYVMQISEGTACDGVTNADPMTVGIMPLEQWGYYYPSSTPGGAGASYFANNNFLNLIKKGTSSIVNLDNVQVPQSSFTQIGTSGYYAAQVTVSVGNHIAVGNSAFLCYSYGYDNADAYGYPASGASLYSITLPIKLSSFTGRNVDGIGVLNWITAMEINNDHFSLERSSDGINFSEIASIKGFGNEQTAHTYTYNDKKLQEGINYYRLKQFDFNGEYEYSQTISIDAHVNDVFKLIALQPNPTTDVIKAVFYTEILSSIKYEVIDITGKIVLVGSLGNSINGTNEQPIDLSNLQPGVYYLQLANSQNQVIREKIIKQ